ncbi:hypothetical protein WJX73_008559 [Symbiochloris irregularis]|uniref:Alpha-ketoglutarate-dependent dioxygenase AlkB-like domain-containing protein n=1 Tax=Symbiochloris irregularis TaxID=706552 RepID=A0AAW1NVY8_9CHLO
MIGSILDRLPGTAHLTLPGHFLFEEFITEPEEAQVVDLVDRLPPAWHNSNFNGPHRGKAWGVQMDLKRGKVLPAAHELPPLLQTLTERMRARIPVLRKFDPTEANAIDYVKAEGHVLRAHVDNRALSTGEIVTLSLQGRAVMTFKAGKEEVRVPLPRRALQVLTGNASLRNFKAKQKLDQARERVFKEEESAMRLRHASQS